MTWRGIVGRAFPTVEEFANYVEGIQFNLWRPKFVVVHNTSAPTLIQYEGHWNRSHPITDERWMQNLVGFYRDQQGWSAGPHLFVTPRSICCFTALNVPGVHSPSWNSLSWGVETVGEFEREPFGGLIESMLVGALGVLHMKAGLSPTSYQLGQHGLHFHKEDPNTTHKTCPGRNMIKADLVVRVEEWIADHSVGEHQAAPFVA